MKKVKFSAFPLLAIIVLFFADAAKVHSQETLLSDVADTTYWSPDYYVFTNANNYWCAVGVRSSVTSDFWEISLYEDAGFDPPPLASSLYGTVSYVVVDNNHAPLVERGIYLEQLVGMDAATIEFEGGSQILSNGTNSNITWPAGDVVKMWDIYLQPGEYFCNLTLNSGTADLGIALFGSDNAPYYADRDDYISAADVNGPGANETFSFTITSADWYGICVHANNASPANFNINFGQPGHWTGTVSSNWNTAANWSDGLAPTIATDVTIASGTPFAPMINAYDAAVCNHLNMISGGVLTMGTGSVLYMWGDLNTDAGQLLMNGDAALYFNGESGASWSDANQNDSYTNIRLNKNDPINVLAIMQDVTLSGTCWLYGGTLFISGTHTLTINDDYMAALDIDSGARLEVDGDNVIVAGGIQFRNGSQADITSGNIYCGGYFIVENNPAYDIVFTGGTLIMNGTEDQHFRDADGGNLSLYNLTIDKASGNCYLEYDNLNVRGDLLISQGCLSARSYPTSPDWRNIRLGGNWTNNEGSAGFEEGAGRVTFDGPSYQQNINNNESFHILEVNKTLGGSLSIPSAIVLCNQYDWTAGGISVFTGSFTAADLLDNGIMGSWSLSPGGTIDITNNDGYIDLNGSISMTGGNFYVHGGTTDSYWPYFDNASITMSGGNLDFTDKGILVYNASSYTLTENITGGFIRTAGGFRVESPDFSPAGGAVEMYGAQEANLHTINGGFLNHLLINKGGSLKQGEAADKRYVDVRQGNKSTDGPMDLNTANIDNSLDVNGNLFINSGILRANANTIRVGGGWSNLVGDPGFNEGSSQVIFDGPSQSVITTNESFYNLTLDKTYAGFDGLEFGTSVTVNANLSLTDGTLELNPFAVLDVGLNVTIADGAGLNADDGGNIEIYCGGSWLDENTIYNNQKGFSAGNTSSVIFDAPPGLSVQVIKEKAPFNDVHIFSGAPYVRPDATFRTISCKNMSIDGGKLHLGGGRLTVTNDLDIFGILSMNSVSDSVVVGDDISWKPGSGDDVTDGKIFTGGDWTFASGTNASLGAGNTVYFTNISTSLIRSDDIDAAFGSLVIGKPSGPWADTYIHGSSSDTLRVNGSMTVNGGNRFHIQDKDLIVNQNLEIQNLGEMNLTNGSLINHHDSFILDGYLNVMNGDVLMHGTFELPATGKIEINTGNFTSDAPLSALLWQEISGTFQISGGTFKITHNALLFAPGCTDIISGGEIIVGNGFSALSPGTFEPSAGKVKLNYNGPDAFANIHCSNGNYFRNLEISGKISLQTNILVKNNLQITSGFLNSQVFDIYIGGNWTNTVGPAGFLENSQKVVFNGTGLQYCYGEEFNVLENNKLTGELIIPAAANVHCNNYDWTAGKLKADGGSFVADDLNDSGLYGTYQITSNGGNLELHQDNSQYTDLNGYLFIDGGHMKVMGGDGASYWPYAADAGIQMSGGVLEFIDNGIYLHDSPFFNLTENVTGGIIRTNKSFHGLRDDFNPTGGTTQLLGGGNAEFGLPSGSCFHHVLISKYPDDTVKQLLPILINGNLSIEDAVYDMSFKTTHIGENLDVNDGGTLFSEAGAELMLANGKTLSVNSGGKLIFNGSPGNFAMIGSLYPASFYNLDIQAGAELAAQYTIFSNMGINGLNVKAGAAVDPVNPLRGCQFLGGINGGTLLTLDNSQTLSIHDAVFPANIWSGLYNVSKTQDQGQVYFIDYSGAFSGETYEQDSFGRIFWLTPLTLTVSSVPAEICQGNPVQLLAMPIGGLPPYTYQWSPAVSLSDPLIANPIANPATNTTYYVTLTDSYGNSVTDSVLVTVHPSPSVDIGNEWIGMFAGTSAIIGGSVGGGAPPYIYQWTPAIYCGDPSALITSVTPPSTTLFTLLVTDAAGCTGIDSISVIVYPAAMCILDGHLRYLNADDTPLSQVSVILSQSGTPVDTTMTDTDGLFNFGLMLPGDYHLHCESSTPWGGVNAADALLVLRHFVGLSNLSGLFQYAANVDNSPAVNSIDALMIAKRYTNSINSFPSGDWAFFPYDLTLTASSYNTYNMNGLCYGDVNGSNVPPFKQSMVFDIAQEDCLFVGEGEWFDLPFSVSEKTPLGALSLVMKLPPDRCKFAGIRFTHDPDHAVFNLSGDTLRLAWYTVEDKLFTKGEPLFYLQLTCTADSEDLLFTALAESELSDHQGNVIMGTGLIYPKIMIAQEEWNGIVSLQPNPSSGKTRVDYNIPQEATISYSLSTVSGQVIWHRQEGVKQAGEHQIILDCSTLAAGVYIFDLIFDRLGSRESRRIKLMVVR
ncbi:MAG TPA: hypothetical protein P5531_03725 [Bacteroidales bacterium]|nr:hypothetical protein [Bacteroidales bacterium]HSA42369.1 hypothetical protein [Bacteroidales bacterium]